jgi:Ca2+-binding RTX toxin-like protein
MLDNVVGFENLEYTTVASGDAATMAALNAITITAGSSFAADTAVRVFTQTASNATVDFTNVTGGSISYTASTSADVITGSNTLGDTIVSGGGSDTINGGGGNDVITISGILAGNVSVNAGVGDDIVNMGIDGSVAMTVADTIAGGSGTDTLVLGGASTATNDLANVTGFETITYGVTSATVAFSYVVSATSSFTSDTTIVTITPRDATDADTLAFTGTNLTRAIILVGGAGVDTLIGGAGADTINGGAGADASINGGAGNDSLTGGESADVIIPGTGNDTIVLTETVTAADQVRFFEGGAANVDTIVGFAINQDRVMLASDAITLVGSLLTSPTFSGTSGVDIETGTTQVIVTVAASAGTINASTSNGVIKFSAAATSYANAIGTTSITLTAIADAEVIAAIWYDSTNGVAVFGGISSGADGSILNITQSDIFVEIARVQMSAADYAALAIGSLGFA